MDDLIFSGAGSGCRGDDEDECMPPFENGSGDDLITPVYVPPTKQTVTATKSKSKDNEKLCDDEDCLHGSGSGEVTDSYSSTSVSTKTDPKGLSPTTSKETSITLSFQKQVRTLRHTPPLKTDEPTQQCPTLRDRIRTPLLVQAAPLPYKKRPISTHLEQVQQSLPAPRAQAQPARVWAPAVQVQAALRPQQPQQHVAQLLTFRL